MDNRMMALAALFLFVLLAGCTGQQMTVQTPVDLSNVSSSGQTGANMSKNPTVVFETTKGTFKAEIYEKEAPITAANFLKLVKSGFYNNLTFHRYVPDFVIQGGEGGDEDTIPLEIIPGLSHDIGALGMARTPDPNSATSQFYIAIGSDAKPLDGQYAVFGKVTEGMDSVMKLRVGDRMTKVYVQ